MLSVICLLFLAVLAAISVASVAIYLRIYTKWVNRRLAGEAAGKPLWSPLRFCLTCAGVFMGILLALFLFLALAPGGENDDPDLPWISYQFYSQDDMEGTYLEGFSLKENPGYTRYVAQDDHFRYTCFLSQTPHDGMHPDFLVFVEYTGGDLGEYDTTGFYGGFQEKDNPEKVSSLWGAGGGTPEPVVCFAGAACRFDGTFTGTYGLLTPEGFDRFQRESEEASEHDEIIDELSYASVKAQFTIHFTAGFGTDAMTGSEGQFSLDAGQ